MYTTKITACLWVSTIVGAALLLVAFFSVVLPALQLDAVLTPQELADITYRTRVQEVLDKAHGIHTGVYMLVGGALLGAGIYGLRQVPESNAGVETG